MVLIELYAKLEALRPTLPPSDGAHFLAMPDGGRFQYAQDPTLPDDLIQDALAGLALFDVAQPGTPAFEGLVAVLSALMAETYGQTVDEFTQLLSS